jgi:tripartite-type tricarboxylate transporter receptor subunit TctC
MRIFGLVILAMCMLPGAIQPSRAGGDGYPSQPVKFIIPANKGGGTDVSFRLLAGALEPLLGQKIEIANLPADSGVEGLTALANAEPDGYTLGAVWNGPLTASPQVRQLPYSLDSFTMVAGTFESDYLVCAHKDFPATTGAEFVALLQQQPFRYTYGNEGKGGSGFFAAERLFETLRVFVRSESFDGSSAVAKNFAAGKVDFYVGSAPPVMPHIKSGDAKCLVIMGKAKPGLFPNAAAVGELGALHDEAALWRMVLAPKGLPAEKAAKLETAIRQAMATPIMLTFFAEQGERPIMQDREQTLARLKAEYTTFSEAAERLGLKPE